ncbi:serine/threonine-protein kinase BLUS1-like isoform X2 [Prosopis cineraria]|uniref:serine/threonine-protein kinase BLUS1-like isoform X2 n=1 Tax=Prosopis cineraria TaxID=364024 RepID=UPI00241031C4|nr:serine/threonine-protein kinase BLUS1-like isoform X2 [Prosopis cineraria]
MKDAEKKKYPIGPEHYELLEEIGQGVSAHVHRARCIPFNEIIAIKILDFERENCDLNNVFREAQTMTLVDHPNVLKSHCSFVSDHNLWVIMPYMAGGSCLHILKAAYPDGFEEVVIATILREVLKGLEYLHHHGHIHRDVKAGNILIDARGAIKLGDFGVSACLFDSGDRQRTRNTFVGTPCWMAPEVMEQLHGYDFKADIWSFGITALELAHGHAPFSKYPPMKVLLMTLQNAPPGLDYERDKKFSKSFKHMIASCLVKDPSKRPTASKLLKNSFFKQARSNDYILRRILEGLPNLGDRIQALKRKDEDMLAKEQMPDGQKEEISQNEYKRGISSWNFNLDDMKAQASLIQDYDDAISEINPGGSSSSFCTVDVQEKQSPRANHSQIADMEDNEEMRNQSASVPAVDFTTTSAKVRSEKSDDDSITSSSHEHHLSRSASPCLEDHVVDHNLSEKCDIENGGRQVEPTHSYHRRCSSSILPEVTHTPTRGEIEKMPHLSHSVSNCNATTVPLSGEANLDDTDEKVKVPVVQQRGRFKVTSENVELEKVGPTPILQKSQSMQVISSHNVTPLPSILPLPPTSEAASSNPSGSSLYQLLHCALQANIEQRDTILLLMKHVVAGDPTVDGASNQALPSAMEKSLLEASHEKEKELLHEITELHKRLQSAQDEIKKLKSENGQV